MACADLLLAIAASGPKKIHSSCLFTYSMKGITVDDLHGHSRIRTDKLSFDMVYATELSLRMKDETHMSSQPVTPGGARLLPMPPDCITVLGIFPEETRSIHCHGSRWMYNTEG